MFYKKWILRVAAITLCSCFSGCASHNYIGDWENPSKNPPNHLTTAILHPFFKQEFIYVKKGAKIGNLKAPSDGFFITYRIADEIIKMNKKR